VNAYFEIKRLKMKFELVTQMVEFSKLGSEIIKEKTKKKTLSLSLSRIFKYQG